MKKLTIYDDPDYGWTVEESSGYLRPCQTVDDVLKHIKVVLERYQPSNKVDATNACTCSNDMPQNYTGCPVHSTNIGSMGH
ncbi:MAG: hypothetical protein GY941_23645 [Planctomycetes bacterium]|nr:hypothetical protein [Planctomycetota bacterium]